MVFGPVQAFTKENVKVRWFERYTSDAVNKKFLGIPRGVYLGFIPVASGLTLTLKTDVVLTLVTTTATGTFAIGDTLTGGTSGATAVVRVVSVGFVLVDSVVGTFIDGETIDNGVDSVTLGKFISEGISHARVVADNPVSPDTSEDMVDIFTRVDESLDFTGFPDGTYFVLAKATYQIGQVTTATIETRTTPDPDKTKEVLICTVDKVGGSLTIVAEAPTTRDEPFAYDGQRIGFMPGGSIESLLTAILTAQEVIASRRGSDGVIAPTFSPGLPQTTGLPSRLNRDLSKEGMADRLGKAVVNVQGNDYVIAAPTSQINVSSSFAARARDVRPVKDVTTGTLPTGVPIAIEANGSENINLTLTNILGAFIVGDQITGDDSTATGIIQSISGDTLTINDIVGSFFVGEGVTGTSAGPPTGDILAIDFREGAITSEEPPSVIGDFDRNVVVVIDTLTNKRPIDSVGDVIYGRLRFGPPGAGPVFDSGEITLTGTVNYVNSNAAVTGTATDFLNEVAAGDIIEGADGRFYEVDSVSGAVNLDLPVAKPYIGPTASVANPRRRRFLLDFVKYSGGAEATATIAAGTYRIFFPAWFSRNRSNFDYDVAMLQPGEQFIPPASTTLPGLALLAVDGGVVPGTVVQANDSRLVGIGQTDTITADQGLQNAGDDVNAIIRPSSGCALGRFGNATTITPTVSIASGAAGPTALNDGTIVIPANTFRLFAIIHYECHMFLNDPFNGIAVTDAVVTLDISNGANSGEVTSWDGYNLRMQSQSFAPNNFEIDHGATLSRMIILTTTKTTAFDPASSLTVEWGEIRREAGNNTFAITVRERKIEVWGF